MEGECLPGWAAMGGLEGRGWGRWWHQQSAGVGMAWPFCEQGILYCLQFAGPECLERGMVGK